MHDPVLLEALLAAPDQDEPRLAYGADLERKGDPRGEWIRLQVLLARGKGSPETVESYRQGLRQEALFKEHGPAWSREFEGLISPGTEHVRSVSFARGMIERVTLTAEQFLENAELLYSAAPIRHLTLTGAMSPELIEPFFASPHLGRTRSLEFRHCSLGGLGIEALARSPQLQELRWLELHGEALEFESFRTIAESAWLGRLEYFDPDERKNDPRIEHYLDWDGSTANSRTPEEAFLLVRWYGDLKWLSPDPRGAPSRYSMA